MNRNEVSSHGDLLSSCTCIYGSLFHPKLSFLSIRAILLINFAPGESWNRSTSAVAYLALILSSSLLPFLFVIVSWPRPTLTWHDVDQNLQDHHRQQQQRSLARLKHWIWQSHLQADSTVLGGTEDDLRVCRRPWNDSFILKKIIRRENKHLLKNGVFVADSNELQWTSLEMNERWWKTRAFGTNHICKKKEDEWSKYCPEFRETFSAVVWRFSNMTFRHALICLFRPFCR